MGGTNDLSPTSTVSTTTSSTQASFSLSCRRLYEALEDKAIDLQVPYILSTISNRIYGRRQNYCPRRTQCHPFHIFFILYSVPNQCAGLPESIRHGESQQGGSRFRRHSQGRHGLRAAPSPTQTASALAPASRPHLSDTLSLPLYRHKGLSH